MSETETTERTEFGVEFFHNKSQEWQRSAVRHDTEERAKFYAASRAKIYGRKARVVKVTITETREVVE